MSEILKEYAEEPEEGFVCDSDQKAEWCILQIKRAQAERERWKAFYKEAMDKANLACDNTIGLMEGFLSDYFRTVPHKVTKTEENYALPGGKLLIKKQDATFEYDEGEVIEWLKANGKGFVKTKESLDWDGLKRTLTVVGETVADDDAEVIPCIRAVEREPVFRVQLKK